MAYAITKLGIHIPGEPADVFDWKHIEYESTSGMESYVTQPGDDGTVLIGRCHDAVGLMTWWRADSFEGALEWLEEISDVAA